MTDQEYSELQARQAALYSKVEAARAVLEQTRAEWLPIWECLNFENTRRQVIADMVADGTIPPNPRLADLATPGPLPDPKFENL